MDSTLKGRETAIFVHLNTVMGSNDETEDEIFNRRGLPLN